MPSNCRRTNLCLTLILLALASVSFAQDGVSTAGAARTRYLGKMGVIPSPREVVVEDIVNYPRHEIGRPKSGEAVGLDVRWGSESVSGNGEAVLQVGLSTALAHDRQELRPLNLSIVIDKSGSMAEDNKMRRVKSALLKLVSQLRPTDVLSIVVFDSDAQVLLPAQPVSDREQIDEVIRGIEPGSTTNLNAGLMLGYQQALKHFREDATNRVILLTDGIANRGVTNPAEIAKASVSYNDRGIDLSTIGVGLDVNQDMLRQLAKSGRGLFHFIADSQDIDTVFVKELQSQISPVATEPNLDIEYGPGLELEKVYGYAPRLGGNSVRVKLDNMNSGMTEVVLLRFKTHGEVSEGSHLPVKVRLNYFDLDRNKSVETTEKSFVTLTESAKTDMLDDSSVAKDFTLASLAQAIHDMAKDCENRQYVKAENDLRSQIEKASRRYPNLDDADIKQTMTTAQRYLGVVHTQNQSEEHIGVESDAPLETTSSDNIIFNGDFSQGNTGFTTEAMPYIAPADNCLWAAGYTVAPRFNNPQLHRLGTAAEFAAPKRAKGNEQVLYENAGGSESLVVWTLWVRCTPNTNYRLRFKSISLSLGLD